MKTKLLPFVFLLTIVSAFADVQFYGPVTPPAFGGTYWSMSWGSSYPPLPCIPLQFQNSDVYGIVGWTNHFVYDDTSNPDHSSSEMMTMDSGGGSGGGDDPQPLIDYGTNLWVSLDTWTNESDGTMYYFTIHNTVSNSVYELISCTNVAAPMNPTNWISEFVALADSTNLAAYVPIGGKKDYNFFRAHLWTDFVYGVPTNGQIFIQSLTNDIYPVINGVTNHLTPFASNWFVLNPKPTNLYALNLGYAMEDGGITNSIINTNPPQQVIRFAGFSKTLTNVCLSSNLLTTLNISGWPALQDVQAWHNTNMLTVYVTNCPQLRRTCFEALQGVNSVGITNALDFSGCPHIAEIRAADNRFPNVIVTNGAGPEVWHLCFHDNTVNQLPTNFNFTVYPSLRELWAWNDHFTGPLTIQNANSTNLQSVQMFANDFKSADFTGQTNLFEIIMYYNFNLTNVNVTGCSKLRYIDVRSDALTSGAMDSVLSTLDALGTGTNSLSSPQVYLDNGTTPSLDGQKHGWNLMNKGWLVSFTPETGAPFISSVSVPAIGSNYATITWTTDIASDSTVYFGLDGTTYLSTNVAGSVTSHSVTLTNLTAATNYYFYVHSTSGGHTGTSGDYQFTTRGGTGIYFVNTSSTIQIEVNVSGSPTITWLWGDGTSTVGGTQVSQVSHTFSSNTTSYVVVNPPSALLGFGIQCQTNYYSTLSTVTGLTNYPNLRGLYLYLTALSDVSLAGCTNLTYVALVGATNVTTATANAWFNDLATAQSGISTISGNFSKCGDPTASFFCPAGKVDSGSGTSRSTLTGKGWSIYFF